MIKKGNSKPYVISFENVGMNDVDIVGGKNASLGEMISKFGDLRLLDYGFAYHKDENFPQDDISWFLLRKDNR